MGIFRDLKRKKREEEDGEVEDSEDKEKSEKYKNKKKIKKIRKIDLEEKVKNDVFSLGNINRHRLGNRIISNLVNA